MRTTIYLFRHAEKMRLPHGTQENYDRIQPLTVNGEQAAKDLLEIEALRHADIAYCSPYARTISTLRYLQEADGFPMILDERLREWDFGGKPPAPPEVTERDKTSGLREPFSVDPRSRQWDNRDLAYENGESLNQCCTRMDSVIREIAHANAGKRILIGTHGHAICAYLSSLMDGIDFRYAKTLPTPSVFRLQFDGAEITEVKRLCVLAPGSSFATK